MLKLKALLLTSVSLLAATSALAGNLPSTLTRADVVAEYQRARQAGELLHADFGPQHSRVASSERPLTRSEVQAEYLRAKQAGEIQRNDYFHVQGSAATPSTLTRADVFKEFVRARDAGELAEIRNDFGSPQNRRAFQ